MPPGGRTGAGPHGPRAASPSRAEVPPTPLSRRPRPCVSRRAATASWPAQSSRRARRSTPAPVPLSASPRSFGSSHQPADTSSPPAAAPQDARSRLLNVEGPASAHASVCAPAPWGVACVYLSWRCQPLCLPATLPVIGALLPEAVVKGLSTPIRTHPLNYTTMPKGSESVAVRWDLLEALATPAGPSVTGQHETGQ